MAPQPQELTKKQLYGLFEEMAKEKLGGMSLEEAGKHLKEVAAQRQQVNRDSVANLMDQDANMSPGGVYEKKAYHVIKRDKKFKGAGLKFARMTRCMALSKSSGMTPASIAKAWGDPWMADLFSPEAMEKALVANLLSSGGAIVPSEYVAEVIEILRAKAVVRRAGVVEVPMRSGTMTLPRQSGAATASYTGEAVNITASQQAFEQLQLTGRKLTALTPVSNDLLREADPAADEIVRNDLTKVMALREDLAFLRGDGSVNTPKGLLNRINTANIFNRTQGTPPTSTLSEITGDLFTAWERVVAANVQIENPWWVMHARTIFGLRKLRDSLGNLVFEPEMRNGTLLGLPYWMSNQLPINLGGGGNQSEVYFNEGTESIIGDTMSLGIDVFPGGSYFDGTAVQSGVSQDLTIVRAIALHDFGMRHSFGGAVIQQVDWQ